MDQQTFSSTANSCASCFGIQDHIHGFLWIRRFINVDMHNPLKMGENGNARFALHQSNQPFATAGNNDIHKFGHLQQMFNRGAITGGDDLNGVLGEARGLQPLHQTGVNGRSAVQAFRAAAQNDRISRLQAQGPRICRDIGAAFINHPDHTKGGTHTADMKARGLIPFCDNFPHGIVLPRNGAQPLCHRRDAIRIQHQTIHHGICQALFTSKIQILGIFGNNMIRRSNHCIGSSQ